jgi:hypothetical protein
VLPPPPVGKAAPSALGPALQSTLWSDTAPLSNRQKYYGAQGELIKITGTGQSGVSYQVDFAYSSSSQAYTTTITGKANGQWYCTIQMDVTSAGVNVQIDSKNSSIQTETVDFWQTGLSGNVATFEGAHIYGDGSQASFSFTLNHETGELGGQYEMAETESSKHFMNMTAANGGILCRIRRFFCVTRCGLVLRICCGGCNCQNQACFNFCVYNIYIPCIDSCPDCTDS